MPVGVAMTHYLIPWAISRWHQCAVHRSGRFEPARNISEIKSNKETSADPRSGHTSASPDRWPRWRHQPILEMVTEDQYVDNMFFVAWGTGDNAKDRPVPTASTESRAARPLLHPLRDLRRQLHQDTVGGRRRKQQRWLGETVWRYDYSPRANPRSRANAS